MMDRLWQMTAPGEDTEGFMTESFSILLCLILDGPANFTARVVNVDALELLFSFLTHSSQFELATKACHCLMDLVSLHPINCVYFEYVGAESAFLRILGGPSDKQREKERRPALNLSKLDTQR